MTDPHFGRGFDAHKWLGPPILLLLLVMGGVGGYTIGGTPGSAIGFIAALAFASWLTWTEVKMRRQEREDAV